MDWTEDRVAQLKQLWGQGLSASQVSRQLGGVSRNAVIGKVHRMGLNGRDRPANPRALAGHSPNRAKPRNHASALPSISRRAPPALSAARRCRVDLPPTTNLMGLGLEACRWPSGDPQTSDFGFCGRQRNGHSAYCADHASLATRRSAEPRADQHAPHERRRVLASGFGRAERR